MSAKLIQLMLRVQSLNEEEQKLLRLYGKLPNRNDLLQNKLKVWGLFLAKTFCC